MSRFGKKLLVLSLIALFMTAALSIIVAAILFTSYNNSIILERAKIGVNFLKQSLDGEKETLSELHSHWCDMDSLITAIENKDAASIEADWKRLSSSEYEFCCITDDNGSTLWNSPNYNITSIRISPALSGSISTGILSDPEMPLFYYYCAPIKSEGMVVGTLTVGFDLRDPEWIEDVKSQSSNETTIFSGKTRYSTTVLNSDGTRAVGTDMSPEVEEVVAVGLKEYTGRANVVGKLFFVCYMPMFDKNGEYVGAYFSGTDTSEADAEFAKTVIFSSLAAVVVMVTMGTLFFIFIRKVVIKPIALVGELAGDMSEGELKTPDFTYKFDNDEIGDFAVKLQETKHRLSAYISDISNILGYMSRGDFSQTPEMEYHGDFAEISESFAKIRSVLGDMLGNMTISSQEVFTGTKQLTEGSQALADGATRQAASIEELSSTMTEINNQVSRNAQNATKAKDYSAEVENKIIRQNEEVNEMVSAMKEIEEKSREIGNIIKTIDDIAFQTNILALNAAVEAARAGEAGKGFAVVADEVRNLASKSAEAANNTTQLITASIEAVDKGSRIAVATAETMKEVMDISKQSAELIVGIADASAQQADSISQVMSGIDQISQVVQMNSATAEETAASCEELSGQSDILKNQISRFII